MSLKTEYSYNEDDFVQNGNGMQELTVTITLCEYRNLIKDISCQDATIEKLREENKKLTEQVQNLTSFIVLKNPEAIKGIENVFKSFFDKGETQAEAVQSDRKQTEEQ